jgi:hypothetical protein
MPYNGCRPEPVLRRALDRLVSLLRERKVNYFYALDQFKVGFAAVELFAWLQWKYEASGWLLGQS